jgi:hypothetical protein
MADNEKSGLKSAFDLAMERMNRRGEGIAQLSAEQKGLLADLAARTKARIAEVEIMYGKKLDEVRASNDAEKIAKVEEEMRREIRKVKDKEESERQKIRGGVAG